MKLTAKQEKVLLDAYKNDGQVFQTHSARKHHPNTLAALVKTGLLKREPVGVVWTLTDSGREALKSVY